MYVFISEKGLSQTEKKRLNGLDEYATYLSVCNTKSPERSNFGSLFDGGKTICS